MSQDVISDGLNQIMNAKQVGKTELVLRRYSKVLTNVLEMMKARGHIDYAIDKEKKEIKVTIIKLNECRAIKPRYYVQIVDVEKYLKRFLPSRRFGTLVISTNAGLIDHKESAEKNIGGSLIAYFY